MGLVVVAYSSLSGKGRGGRLFEAGRLLTFSVSRMYAYSRWVLIRGWALIRINTAIQVHRYCTKYETFLFALPFGNRFIQENESRA